MMKKILKIVTLSLLSLFILIAAILLFLLTTTPGVYATVKLVNLSTLAHVQIKKARGRLIDEISFKTLVFQDDSQKIVIKEGRLKWKPLSLLHGELPIHLLKMEDFHIKTYEPKETVEDTAKTATKLPELPFDIEVSELKIGKLTIQHEDQARSLYHVESQIILNQQEWSIRHLSFDHENIHHAIKASFNPQVPYKINASLESEGELKPNQPLKANLHLTGRYDSYQLSGSIQGPVDGAISGRLKQFNDIFLDAHWTNADWPLNDEQAFISQSGQLNISGTLTDMFITLKASLAEPLDATLNVETRIQDQWVRTSAQIHTLEGLIQSNIDYSLDNKNLFKGNIHATQLNLSPVGFPVGQLNLNSDFVGSNLDDLSLRAKLDANYYGQKLNLNIHIIDQIFNIRGDMGPNHISLSGKPKYDWSIDGLIARPDLLHPALKGLNTSIKIQGKAQGPQQGQLDIVIDHGSFRSPEEPNLPLIAFEGGKLQAMLNAKGLSTSGKITIDPNKFLFIDYQFPGFSLAEPSQPNQPIDGRVRLNIDTLDFLNHVSPDIKQIAGRISAEITTTGTVKNPNLNGHIELLGASMYLPRADLTYSPVTAIFKTSHNHWTISAKAIANGQTLAMEGKGAFSPQFTGQVRINGNRFPAVQTAEYAILASPDLTLKFEPGSLEVNGTVLIPKASLKPISFSNTQSLSEDVVFVPEKQQSEPLRIQADVDIQMGEEVKLDVKGLMGSLVGNIRIRKQGNSTPFAVGELRITDGKYQAYGQDLTIQEGQLLFSGGLITNPGIRVRAVRLFNNASSQFGSSNRTLDFSSGNIDSWGFGDKVTVGIQVSGRVKSPKIELFSVPSNMSQADILSMLILGRPSGQAGQAGGQLLLTALSSMNIGGGTQGTQLLSQLKQNLGLDFNVNRSSSYDRATNETSESTSVGVGKSITKRAYISYNVGLFQDNGSIFTLKYLLNKYFTIQVNASDTGSGIDFLYNHSKE